VKSNRIVTVIIIGVVLVAIGIFVGLTAHWMPVQASAESRSVDSLFNFMLAIATVVFLIVEGGIIYSIIRFRRRAGDDSDGPPDHGNTALEVTWTAIPAVIVFILTIYSYKVFSEIQAPQSDEIKIGVNGQQFQWSFSYPFEPFPDLTAEQNEAASQNMNSKELHVPANRSVRVEITSADVMHGFYVPEFRIKQDAIPGHITSTRFTATEKGTYQVMCSELCGEGHAKMSTLNWVFVEDQADYEKFVASLRGNARLAATDPRRPERGKQLMINKYPCGACHTLTDAGLTGTIGPTLEGIAAKALHNEDNRLTNSGVSTPADYIRLSIVSPSAYLVPSYPDQMPKNFGDPSVMPEDDREAIVNYLLSLSPETAATPTPAP
jgi:cytochrome c oxidase subunit II